ncbi:hypothetical protein MW290_11675 [Aquincola tertiaricarbonis]|uniref:Uncharacterized protein n=1 Tax=Aquincola tertiaricarbonis TaxID=391953 RepID=A0ABY4S653_AQUTE|nr:hypothetical protein [Aquincola tertiaricarbonis]URI06561.1 hypothetical protein MW290_11675 [Aquincola tertiaricarbonis]
MNLRKPRLPARLAVALALAATAGTPWAASPGFVTLSADGERVMTRCNPRNLAAQQRCRVASLPGEAGYTLVASRSSAVVKNDVVIGQLLDRVWKRSSDGSHIFGLQLQLNANAYDLTGLSFNANDVFRQVREDKAVAIAYYPGSALKALKKAGRTLQGLNEVPPVDDDDDDADEQAAGVAAVDAAADAGNEPIDYTGPRRPLRNNGWVDFRIDANAAEPQGPSSAHSPWLLVRTKAPAGYSVQPFAIRLLSSDFPDSSQFTELYLSGYQPD